MGGGCNVLVLPTVTHLPFSRSEIETLELRTLCSQRTLALTATTAIIHVHSQYKFVIN